MKEKTKLFQKHYKKGRELLQEIIIEYANEKRKIEFNVDEYISNKFLLSKKWVFHTRCGNLTHPGSGILETPRENHHYSTPGVAMP